MSIIHKDIPQKETYSKYYNNDVPLVSPSGETLPYINLRRVNFTFATKVVLCLFVINRFDLTFSPLVFCRSGKGKPILTYGRPLGRFRDCLILVCGNFD